jgi:2-oxoglutarate ferredoxin oxidoreductase subunit alpha
MMHKRMRKMEGILKELPAPQLDGPKDAELTLVGWGSTYQVRLEAMDVLNQDGPKVNVLCLRNIWPFQVEAVSAILSKTKMTMSVEGNYIGQMVKLIRMETGVSVQHHLRKIDGEPFELKQVVDQARTILKTKPKASVVVYAQSDEGIPADFSPIEHPAIGAEAARQH